MTRSSVMPEALAHRVVGERQRLELSTIP